MAKLSAHGKEIGTIYGLTSAKRYMSDGKVLKNSGFGWKLYSTCKPNVTPQEAFDHATAKRRAAESNFPAYLAYRKELHDLAGLDKRWRLHAAITAMPDDSDGVWSEACDSYGENVHADCDEIAYLCRLYIAAVAEREEQRKSLCADTYDPTCALCETGEQPGHEH